MAAMMAYAAAVGSAVAQREAGAVGFVGCVADATARFFGQARGLGTMPHALIGYAGSTVRAAEMFHEVFPSDPITVLIDYFGHEISDAIAVAQRFPDLAAAGQLAVRIDTPGSPYCEGLDPARS
jgi:nicotinate phosphoribosyltransferase